MLNLMKIIFKGTLICIFLAGFIATSVFAQKNNKSGYSGQPGFGGPASVGAQLEEDDEEKEPAVRIPEIDAFVQPWFDWKASLAERTGITFGIDYSALYLASNNDAAL